MQEEAANRTKRSQQSRAARVFGYFKSRAFWLTVLGIAGATLVLFFVVNAMLAWYTNHGQRLEVGEYIGMDVGVASKQIKQSDFRVEIIDSIFLVDQPPHVVLRQDPEPGAFVKENRRIYLTVTKKIPDEVRLPSLAGTYDFDRYQRKLNMLDINARVRDKEYSSRYQPNTILKVYYKNKEITEQQLKSGFTVPKGSSLEFLVTSREGGLADVPDLKCRTLEEARFFIDNYRLRTGRIEADATVTDRELAYVWRQDPPADAGIRIPFDSEVHLFVTAQRPPDCDDGI